MEILSIFFIGIGLSMDALSLSLCYGVLELSKRKRIILSSTVGVFHFVMPLFGMTLGNILEKYIIIDIKIIVYIIFMLIGLEMLFDAMKKETNVYLTNFIGTILFAFVVSIDSFSAGIGIKFISNNFLQCSLIFSITSFCFTYMGLIVGRVIGSRFSEPSKFIGGIILILFSLMYLF
ncbi:MAG TPA: hypothetical protein GXZ95_00990 [Mollicutes bacterium]|nr:hypothetical protein [Mollicutes bacterium]